MIRFTVTRDLDLTQFHGYRVRIDRPTADGIDVPGVFVGTVVECGHYPPHPGGIFDLDAADGRKGGRTALALPYGSTIAVLDEN